MKYSIAVTGATGFIGRAVISRLADQGYHVKALVRPRSLDKCCSRAGIDWVTGQLEDRHSLVRLLEGCHAVVHCAGAVRGASRRDFENINIKGLEALLNTCRGIRPSLRFLLISSLAAKAPHLSYYAASKYKAEEVLASMASGMSWHIFRPPAVYGPGDRELLPLLKCMARGIAPVVGTGRNRFSLLFVQDLADAVTSWIKADDAPPHKTYELHDGRHEGYSWHDVIEAVEHFRGRPIFRVTIPIPVLMFLGWANLAASKIHGRPPMLTPWKVRELAYPYWIGDNAEIERDLGWTPAITLRQGLELFLFKDGHVVL